MRDKKKWKWKKIWNETKYFTEKSYSENNDSVSCGYKFRFSSDDNLRLRNDWEMYDVVQVCILR